MTDAERTREVADYLRAKAAESPAGFCCYSEAPEALADAAALDRAADALAKEDAAAQAEPLAVLSCPPCEDGDDPQRTLPAGAWVLDAVTHDHGNEARAPTEREARALLAARLRATAQRLERDP